MTTEKAGIFKGQIVVIPGRRHKCEKCGTIYHCDECTLAMRQHKGRAYGMHPLYSMGHRPLSGTFGSKLRWHCSDCQTAGRS